MRRFGIIFCLILFATAAICARAQVVSSASAGQFSVTAGGMASVFQPDFVAGDWKCTLLNTADCYDPTLCNNCWNPFAASSNQPLFGVGAYVDVKLTHWVQLEAEGRWLRFNQFDGIHQDNYLIGPRVPVYHFRRANVYAKTLVGFSKMTFYPKNSPGNFTDIAFGGGVDVKLTKRVSFRAADFEYHYWPTWGNSTLSPYGASMGMSYRIF
jgi:hypothetical protein